MSTAAALPPTAAAPSSPPGTPSSVAWPSSAPASCRLAPTRAARRPRTRPPRPDPSLVSIISTRGTPPPSLKLKSRSIKIAHLEIGGFSFTLNHYKKLTIGGICAILEQDHTSLNQPDLDQSIGYMSYILIQTW